MAKRNNDNQPIEDILKAFVKSNNLESGLDNVDVKKAWKELMGNGIVNYTTRIELKQQVLIVELSSSVLREELSYGNEKIVNMLNEHLGKELIEKLILR